MLSIKSYEKLEKDLKSLIKDKKLYQAVLNLISDHVDVNPMQKAFDNRDLSKCVNKTKKSRTNEENERGNKGVYIRTEVDSMKGDKKNPNM